MSVCVCQVNFPPTPHILVPYIIAYVTYSMDSHWWLSHHQPHPHTPCTCLISIPSVCDWDWFDSLTVLGPRSPVSAIHHPVPRYSNTPFPALILTLTPLLSPSPPTHAHLLHCWVRAPCETKLSVSILTKEQEVWLEYVIKLSCCLHIRLLLLSQQNKQ